MSGVERTTTADADADATEGAAAAADVRAEATTSGPVGSGTDGGSGHREADGTRRWLLLDEAEFLRRSIDDADREYEAGDLSAEDHRLLRGRDEARLDVVEEELAALTTTHETDPVPGEGPAGDPGLPATAEQVSDGATGGRAGTPPRRRRRRRRWLAVVGVALLAAGMTLGILRATSPRLLGEGATGSVTVNGTQLVDRQLAQAAQEVDQGSTTSLEEGIAIYRQVLREDPHQPQALAEAGYLTWEAGYEAGQSALADRGRAMVFESIGIEPDDYAAHLFAGTIDLRQGNDAPAAVAEFRAFLVEHPPAALVAAAASTLRTAFAQAGQPVPAGIPAS